MKERLKYIDGIKGIACFLVFVHHFLLAFYIAYFTGNPAESHTTSQIDVEMAQSPLSVVVNGQFWVCMFILVSSFLAAKQIFSTNNMERVAGSIWKRYFRLMLPMLVIGIITWAMHAKEMFTNQEVAQITGSWWLEAYFEQPLSFKEMLYTVLYDVWMGDVEASVQISHAFWMMTYLLVGYYMVVLLTFVVKHTTKWSYCLLVLAAGIAFKFGHYYYLTVIAGVWLADLSRSIQENKVKKWYQHVTCVVLLLLGLYLGGYPSGVVPTNHYAKLPFGQITNVCIVYHVLAAIIVFGVLLYWKPFQRFCCLKPFCMLGTLCYSIFLVQTPIEFSLSLNIFQSLLKSGRSYHVSVCISFLISTVVLLISAGIFHVLVEKNCDRGLKFVQERLLKKKER